MSARLSAVSARQLDAAAAGPVPDVPEYLASRTAVPEAAAHGRMSCLVARGRLRSADNAEPPEFVIMNGLAARPPNDTYGSAVRQTRTVAAVGR